MNTVKALDGINTAIDQQYNLLIKAIAQRAGCDIEDGVAVQESIYKAIDEELIYRIDQAMILYKLCMEGVISWSDDICADDIMQAIYSDTMQELSIKED